MNLIDLRAALRGGVNHFTVNQPVSDPAESGPAEVGPVSNDTHTVPPDRSLGGRGRRLIRSLASPFLVQLRRQVSFGVDASLSAQVLQQVLSSQQVISAQLEMLKRGLDRVQYLSAAAVEFSSKGHQTGAVSLGAEVLAYSPFGWLLLPSEDLRLVAIMLETGGLPAPGTVAVIQALLEPNDLAIDVGAHVGAISIAMARSVGPHGRILAIEPTPRSATLLRRTCVLADLERTIQIEQCAIGAEDGTANLALGVTSAHNSLLPRGGATDSVEVQVRSLDSLLPAGSCPALVKIDAEGFELEVWRGMQRILREAPDTAVIVKFGPNDLKQSGLPIEAWFEALTTGGFTPWEIDEGSCTIRPLRSSRLQDVFSMNVLLSRDPPIRWPRLRIAI
jgi:FkbM family methyltransferase